MTKDSARARGRSAGQLALSLIGIVLVVSAARWAWRAGPDWRLLAAGVVLGLFYAATDRLRWADGLPPRERPMERLGGWALTLATIGVLAGLEWPFGRDNVAGLIVFLGPSSAVLWVARRRRRSTQVTDIS